MSMIFYSYQVPEDCPLYDMECYAVFIAYNPIDGETAFFNVLDGGDVIPFDAELMRYVGQRWVDFCKERGMPLHQSPEEGKGFNIHAHQDFMRSL